MTKGAFCYDDLLPFTGQPKVEEFAQRIKCGRTLAASQYRGEQVIGLLHETEGNTILSLTLHQQGDILQAVLQVWRKEVNEARRQRVWE